MRFLHKSSQYLIINLSYLMLTQIIKSGKSQRATVGAEEGRLCPTKAEITRRLTETSEPARAVPAVARVSRPAAWRGGTPAEDKQVAHNNQITVLVKC